jgi:integrase
MRFKRPEMHTLDETQARNFLLAAQDCRFYTLFHLAITTGLRMGELLGLKWSDLDWTSHSLHIQRQLQRMTGKGLVFTEPKSQAGRRVIVLGKSTIEVLRVHYNRQFKERESALEGWNKEDTIFISTSGTPLDPRNVFREYKETLEKAGCPEIRFHDLRHTAASLMLQQNVHPKVVQERLGHSDISLTLNTYSHVMPGMQQDAADKIDELLTLVDVKEELEKTKKKAKVAKY